MAIKVNQESGQLACVSADWPMLRALNGGSRAMREGKTDYLPKWPKEDQDTYNCRLATATLHPVFRHTCEIMSAKPFARPISMTGVDAIEKWFDDVDLQGTPLQSFAHNLMFQCLSYGLTCVLTDMPTATNIKTRADEVKAGIRPYLTVYPAWSILGWTSANNKLTMIRLAETVTEQDGDWGVKFVKQVRVLRPGTWEIYRQVENNPEEWFVYQNGRTTVKEIPVVFFYGNKLSFGVGQSPLIDIAFNNVKHYQSESDQDTIGHVARVPILFGTGFQPTDNITIGSSDAVIAEDATATLQYVEHSGEAINSGRQALLDLEDRMRMAGADLTSGHRPGLLTATQVDSEGEGNRSKLQAICENFEESFEACLGFMAEFVNAPTEIEFEVFKDFGAASPLEPQLITIAVTSGIISKRTAFEELTRRGIISPECTWEDETKRLTDQGPIEPLALTPQAKPKEVA